MVYYIDHCVLLAYTGLYPELLPIQNIAISYLENSSKINAIFCTFYVLRCHHMQGVDPDAPEEDDENDVEDADADQEETELL